MKLKLITTSKLIIEGIGLILYLKKKKKKLWGNKVKAFEILKFCGKKLSNLFKQKNFLSIFLLLLVVVKVVLVVLILVVSICLLQLINYKMRLLLVLCVFFIS